METSAEPERPTGWVVQRDDVDPPQFLSRSGEWVLTVDVPTWFNDADEAVAAVVPAGTTGTVVQMWDTALAQPTTLTA